MVRAALPCTSCDKKVTTSKQLEKHVKKYHPDITEKLEILIDDDDDVMIVDDEEDQPNYEHVGRPSVGRLMNISNENIIPEDEQVLTADMKAAAEDDSDEEVEDKAELEDDEIKVVKLSIFKYHGKVDQKDEYDGSLFTFSTYEDFEDDVVILEDEDFDEDDIAETEEAEEEVEEEGVGLVDCSECSVQCEEEGLEEHMVREHPPREKEVRHFPNGCFFMLS